MSTFACYPASTFRSILYPSKLNLEKFFKIYKDCVSVQGLRIMSREIVGTYVVQARDWPYTAPAYASGAGGLRHKRSR